MHSDNNVIRIVVADDDPDDQLLITEALRESRLANGIDLVDDGVELMDYLKGREPYAERAGSPLPGLILLDLNMPRKDGREALAEIKGDPELRRIPITVLTTSEAEEDILRTYDLGVNSFIVKPVTFEKLAATLQAVTDYWFQIVRLPPDHAYGAAP